MEDSPSASRVLTARRAAAYAAIVVLGGAVGVYAVHEHRTAQNLAAQNEQMTAALNTTRNELSELTAKINTLASRSETESTPSASSSPIGTTHRAATPRRQNEDPRFKKLQTQVDAQGKAIEETRNDLSST